MVLEKSRSATSLIKNVYLKYSAQMSPIEATYFHPFFSKALHKSLIIPNMITVKSFEEDDDQYTGSATDAESYAIKEVQDFYYAHLTSNTQAQNIAEAKIKQLQVEGQKGAGVAPLNVGAEVYDYVNIIDSVEVDERAGNISYLKCVVGAGIRPEIEFGYGKVPLGGLVGTTPTYVGKTDIETSSYSRSTPLTINKLRPITDAIGENFNELAEFKAWAIKWIEYLLRMVADLAEGVTEITNVTNNYITEGSKTVHRQLIDSDTSLVVGDGLEYWPVPIVHDGWEIVKVGGQVIEPSTSGTPTFQIHNLMKHVDILSTEITIDVGEYTSDDSATLPVINSSYNTLTYGEIYRFDCDDAGTDTEGGFVWLEIRKPSE